MRRLCTVCARGGSKGVKGKNLRELGGLPLIALSLIQAKRSGLFQVIAVSSDSDAILETAGRHGADLLVKRPGDLATDEAGKLPAIQHCVLAAEERAGARFDRVVDLDCTSPLRLVADIAGALELLETSGAPVVVTGAPARRSPYFNLLEERPDGTVTIAKAPARPIRRRQDAPRCFDMNASIYVWRREALFSDEGLFVPGTRLFEMPEERSLDIDSELDFELVEGIVTRRGRFQEAW